MSDKKKGVIFYDVQLIRNFRYPKAMLERGDEQNDAYYKAHNDIYKDIHEITTNKFEEVDTHKFFKTEVKQDCGWKLRNNSENKNQVNLEEIISHFACADFEKKYGILNIEENPDLFEFQAEDQEKELEECWYLKETLEKELSKIKANYRAKLKKFERKDLEVPRYRRGTPDSRPHAARLTGIYDTIRQHSSSTPRITWNAFGSTASSSPTSNTNEAQQIVPPRPLVTGTAGSGPEFISEEILREAVENRLREEMDEDLF